MNDKDYKYEDYKERSKGKIYKVYRTHIKRVHLGSKETILDKESLTDKLPNK